MFHALRYFLFAICILKSCVGGLKISNLKSCKEDDLESKICLTGEDGYFNPFPVSVNAALWLKKIIEIDINKNSITAQFQLSTSWLDPGITLSNISSG